MTLGEKRKKKKKDRVLEIQGVSSSGSNYTEVTRCGWGGSLGKVNTVQPRGDALGDSSHRNHVHMPRPTRGLVKYQQQLHKYPSHLLASLSLLGSEVNTTDLRGKESSTQMTPKWFQRPSGHPVIELLGFAPDAYPGSPGGGPVETLRNVGLREDRFFPWKLTPAVRLPGPLRPPEQSLVSFCFIHSNVQMSDNSLNYDPHWDHHRQVEV